MKLPPARARSAGFTLLELVVSSSVMVGILTAAYLCLQAGLGSEKVVASRMDVAQSARVALALMAADLRAAAPLDKDMEFVGMDREIDGREGDNLDFATHNYRPAAPREADFVEISYYVDRNPETGKFGLYRRRDPSPDGEPLDGGSREEIATGIRGLKIEYYDGFYWYDDWGEVATLRRERSAAALSFGNLFGMPEAVRITLAFEDPQASADPKSKGGPPDAAPLVFQTIVRLNLAPRSTSASSTGSTGTESGGGR